MAITYKPASPQCFDAFWALEQRCHALPWSESNLYSCLMGNYWGELMQLDGKAVGFYLLQQVLDELTLVNICIDPQQQGKGLGKRLLDRAIEQTQQRDGAVLFLEVRASNKAAIGLYQSCGFSHDSVRSGYYPAPSRGGREDAVLMSFKLG